jgi:hypothetical protein
MSRLFEILGVKPPANSPHCPICDSLCTPNWTSISYSEVSKEHYSQTSPWVCSNCHAAQINPTTDLKHFSPMEIKLGWKFGLVIRIED